MDRALRLVIVEGPPAQLQGLLEREGFATTAPARRRSELLPWVGRHRPDAIVVDFDRLESSGTTTIRRLVERYPKVPAIVLADSAWRDDIADLFEAGAAAYIVKTGDLHHLGDAIRFAVAMRHPEGVPEAMTPDDPIWMFGGEAHLLPDRRAGVDRRARAAGALSFERRTGAERRQRARRGDDRRLAPAT
jgi:DNA-binding response OmpR family regulator